MILFILNTYSFTYTFTKTHLAHTNRHTNADEEHGLNLGAADCYQDDTYTVINI